MPKLFENLPRLPKPFDRARANRTLDVIGESEPTLDISGSAKAALEAAFGNSPFLCRLALRERTFLSELVNVGPEACLARIEDDALSAAFAAGTMQAMEILRRAKRQAALAIALADIAGLWNVDAVTGALTAFADACVRGALRFLLRNAAGVASLSETDAQKLEAETGLVVLAMGKYGAFELNYSSDIDLVIFYDAGRFPFRRRDEPRAAAVDIVRGLVKLLSETTADGYVFRVDLRLRPDAGATQVAISTEAAEIYYEGMGQNWERAAMIKARACAGDPVAYSGFETFIEPFIWRKNLDYAAIEDIHSIKRQIHAHAGHEKIAIAGHNIKLGRGGIREIEFFAQTQQLIAGGRNRALRPRGTLQALEALRQRGLIADRTAQELTHAYRFLRHVEHRLQMIDDQQTHTLPESDEDLRHVALFSGFDGVDSFSAALRKQLEIVQNHYAQLFESSAPLANVKGSLVFTGVEDDLETTATLRGMGFRDPAHVSGAVRAWHHGRIRATRSARAREILTALLPALLEALAGTADPDAAFVQFDRFFSRLNSGIQILSLLQARPELLKLIAEICGSAPRLADHLARTPTVLDALLDPGFLQNLPSREALTRALAEQMHVAATYEDALDVARRFAREQIFRVGVQIIQGTITADDAGPAFANVAEVVIAAFLPIVQKELASSAGTVDGGAFAVIAMGKLGGREMTAESDLDLVFVYDTPESTSGSNGAKPLAVSLYYARLAQRLISALTTLTGEGGLYEVDMRLRPSGNKGPVAVALETFERYHNGEAWTWERMALTRARVIVGGDDFRIRIDNAIRDALRQHVDSAKLFQDAREMRGKLAAEFPGSNSWDLKFAPGALVDIEFVAQSFQLRAVSHDDKVVDANTIGALMRLAAAGEIEAADAQTLISAARMQQALLQVLRIAVDGTLDPEGAAPGLKTLLARAAGTADFEILKGHLSDAQTRVRSIFDRLMNTA
ncbi:MAG TPA: bifunctional [glutamine synthetase] adenylyltransferase/[glutamine synthetase]-adenylyl-L-tyrosine phosphorylase [Rhizomicrobium sp.]|nr:bifunctional [glutamine synthetase] adenylyltransferase/[glutamine synthetase]-adenylyl-L-tyrosine phosphorylase [Rhizomicrobium sp.]